MVFILMVLSAALLIEGLGTVVSVIGLSALFSGNPIVIALAVALDIGKLVSVSFLYNHWKRIGWLMKSYMTVAATVLMLITSAGAFGFLSGQFQQAISGTNQQAVVLTALTDEQGRLQKRKEAIDKQIAQLPDNIVSGRSRLIRQFAPEVNRINNRLVEIDKELPKLKIENIQKNVEVGPIIYVAEAFNTTPEHAVKWVILTIIFVFDPLAIALLLAGNYLIEIRKRQVPATLDRFDPVQHGGEVGQELAPIVKSQPIVETKPVVEAVSVAAPEFPADHESEAQAVPISIPEETFVQSSPMLEQPIQAAPIEISEFRVEPKPILINRPDEKVLEPIGATLNQGSRDVITLDQVRPATAPVIRSSLDGVDAKRSDVEMEGDQTRSTTIGTYQDRA